MKKEVWYWWWGTDQNNLELHSRKLKFTNFSKMKAWSAAHSFNHEWLKPGYWSDYERVEEN